MNEFLDSSEKPRIIQEEINSSKKETEIKSLPIKKHSGPAGFTAEFYTTIRELQLNTLNYFLKFWFLYFLLFDFHMLKRGIGCPSA